MIVRQSNGGEPLHELKEQLRLFAFDDAPMPSANSLTDVQCGLSKRERLIALLESDLNFHGEHSGYASHDFHAFAAKFPPQLPRAFIRGLTNPGDIVLDPMMGSGTTVVEAVLEGRQAIGLDIDPLALRLGYVKTTPLNIDVLRSTGYKVISLANSLLSHATRIDQELESRFDEPTKKFIDYWFLPTTQRELMSLIIAIEEVADVKTREFLELTFSSIIITKSGGVSRARDLAHSRPHLDETKIPKNALEQFVIRMRKNLSGIAELKLDGSHAALKSADARSMPLDADSVDLIVTSPPYANAIDYMRAHKFSLVWFGKTVANLTRLRAEYIGSERIGNYYYAALPPKPESIIQELTKLDHKKAEILRKYFDEMRKVLVEMYRVLRDESAAIIVVGTSLMRNIDVQTHYCLADIAATIGFDVVGVAQRALDRNKRMMPARFGKKTDSMIEQRMHEEYVIGLLKAARPRGDLNADAATNHR